jgi:hypothetical protein
MTIEQSKEKLKKDGYTWLELSEFNPEFYNFLLPFKCNEENNLKDKITCLRLDAKKQEYSFDENNKIVSHTITFSEAIKDDFQTFENASQKKEELINIIKKDKDIFCSQVWYYNDLPFIIGERDEMIKYENHIANLVKYYFDLEDKQELILVSPACTYYDTDCELKNHSDGTGTGRVCALLIYLNEEYDESNGGYLVLNNTEKVIPAFGRVAIIDLQTFDIPHMVTKVTGGIGRYAMLSFVKKKEDEFVHNKYEMEHIV